MISKSSDKRSPYLWAFFYGCSSSPINKNTKSNPKTEKNFHLSKEFFKPNQKGFIMVEITFFM